MRLRFWTSQKEHDELAARITHLEAYQKRSAEVLSNNIGPAIIDLRKQISAQKDQYDLLEKQRGATHALLAHLQARVTRVELLVDRLRRRRGGNDGVDSNDMKKKDVQEFDESKHNDNNNNYVGKGKGRMIDVQNATAHEQLPTQHQHQYDIPSPLQLRRAARRRSRPVGDKAFNNSGRLPRRNGDIMSWTPAERDLYGPLIQDGGAGQPKR